MTFLIIFLIWTDFQSNTTLGPYNQFCFGDASFGPLECLHPVLGALHSGFPRLILGIHQSTSGGGKLTNYDVPCGNFLL
jgi:hypothetical protein